jgi:hypothetical protein
MKIEKFEWSVNGLIIDGKKYGACITKLEIDGGIIKLYISPMCKHFDKLELEAPFNDMCNPQELIKYDNIRIIEDGE